MDGVTNPFVRLNEIDAWDDAQYSQDFFLSLFAGLLTERDLKFLRDLRVWGIDDRR